LLEADPTNEEKALEFRYLSMLPSACLITPLTILSLVEDYAERFGDFVPDAAIEPYIMHRNWVTERLDGLWMAAGVF
jgi:hypothetical protein